MKASGTLTFTRHPDGSVSHKWVGGRRIEIQGRVVAIITGDRKRRGDVVELGGMRLRIIGHSYYEGLSTFQDSYIAMREGYLARFVAWYARTAVVLAPHICAFETKVFGWHLPLDGGEIRKRSLTGLLLRWV